MYEEEYKVETVDEPVQTQLPMVEGDYVEENKQFDNSWYDYQRINLSELEDAEQWKGRPLLLPIEKVQWDPEDTPKYRCRLLLIDDELKSYVQINLNLKSDDPVQHNVHIRSMLYALIGGIMELEQPGWTSMYNRIKEVNIHEWRKFINSLESIKIQAKAMSGDGFEYNTFKIVDLK